MILNPLRYIQILLFPCFGFRFKCKRCGSCCCIPGSVFFSEEELQEAAAYLNISRNAFHEAYIARKFTGLWEIYTEERCPLYSPEQGCSIYPVRPEQCRTFPFWKEHFRSPGSILELYRKCPGMGYGPRYSPREIKKRTAQDGSKYFR